MRMTGSDAFRQPLFLIFEVTQYIQSYFVNSLASLPFLLWGKFAGPSSAIIVLVRSFYDILSYGGAYNQGRFVASSFSNASMILRFSIVRSIGDSPCSSMRRASPRISNRKLSRSTFTVLWAKSTSI